MNEEIIGIEVSGEIYPIKDEKTSGKTQTLETKVSTAEENITNLETASTEHGEKIAQIEVNIGETDIQELKSLVDSHEEELKELEGLIDDTTTSETKTWSSEKINNSLMDRVPFKFGIADDGRYGYYKEGASVITPFERSSVEFIGGYGYTQTVTLTESGEYIITAVSYAGAGSSTARSYTELTSVSDGSFESLEDTVGQNYSVRAYRVIAISDNVTCTFKTRTNMTVIKIG